MNTLDQALALADRGIPSFPCLASKAPACEGGFQAATTDKPTLRALFASGAPLIGVPTGAASGMDVLDLDPRHGSDAWWTENEKRIPFTLTHTTRSGGKHMVFKHQPGLRCSASRIAPGCDVRADGGYVVWWPAAGCPEWLDDDPQPWPVWLLSGLATRPVNTEPRELSAIAPPSAAAVVELLANLPNPVSATRDTYAQVMLAARGCEQALGGDDGGAIADAAIEWAERWEGGSQQDERRKWQDDWARRDNAVSGWQTLLLVARTLMPGYVDPTAGREFDVLPPAPASMQTNLLEFTEDHAARMFANTHRNLFKLDHSDGKWYAFRPGVGWDDDQKAGVVNATRIFLHTAREVWGLEAKDAIKAASSSFISNVVSLSKSDPMLSTTAAEWDLDPMALGVPGGHVDLRTGALRPADPAKLMRRRCTVAPVRAPCPVWDKFLYEATGRDAGLVSWLQRFAGYVLTGDVSEEMLAFVYGPGKNGKGVFLRTVSSILGGYAYQAPAALFDASTRTDPQYQLAKLEGIRLLMVSETEAGSMLAESFVKEITGNEGKLNARHPYGRPFEFRSQAKVLIVGNHAPKLTGRSEAMERRLRVVPFNNKPAKPDPTLKDRLTPEYPMILQWMVDGCAAWQQERLGLCSAIAGASESYFMEQDTLAQWVAERCDTSNAEIRTPTSELMDDWNMWLRQRGDKPVNARDFKEAMTQRLPRHEYLRTMKGSMIKGLALDLGSGGLLD